MQIFLIWRRLVRWLRQLILALSAHKPVDWSAEIDSLTDIANAALDYQGKPMLDPNKATTPTSAPSPVVPPKTRLFHGRLIEWLRRKNTQRKADEKTAEAKTTK